MTTVPLGEIIAPARVQRAGERDFPVLSMTMRDGLVLQDERFKKRIASTSTHDYKIVQRGQLVVGFPIDEGVLDVQSTHEEAIVSPAYGIWDLRPDGSVDGQYLRKFLRSPEALAYYKAKLRGSTARRRSLPAEVFLALPVFLPTMSEQRRIAAILDQADAIRTKRRQVLTHLDALPVAAFIRRFGEPDHARRTVPLGEVARLSGGRNLVAEDQTQESPFRVLKISAVTSGVFRAAESKWLPSEYVPPASHLVREGDLLMSRANTAELVGATALVGEVAPNLALPDKVWRFEWLSPETDPLFVHTLLSVPSMRRRISRLASGTGGSMKNVPKEKLMRMALPAVSAADQRAFADGIRSVHRARLLVDRALDRDDALFASLQARAFRGEL